MNGIIAVFTRFLFFFALVSMIVRMFSGRRKRQGPENGERKVSRFHEAGKKIEDAKFEEMK